MLDEFKDIHERFMNKYRSNPRTMVEVAREIGISNMVLRDFIYQNVKPSLITVIKVDNWLKRNE